MERSDPLELLDPRNLLIAVQVFALILKEEMLTEGAEGMVLEALGDRAALLRLQFASRARGAGA